MCLEYGDRPLNTRNPFLEHGNSGVEWSVSITMKVLILGGTRFVGKRLVHLLAGQGHSITVGSRGRTNVSFPKSVRRITLDRGDKDSLATALAQSEWDIVFDQICFSADDAAIAVEILTGKTQRYVLCSSAAVYKTRDNAAEEIFDPLRHPIPPADGARVSYAEGKRLAEAVSFQRAQFPVVAVRFPIILGPDDYSQRLRVQVQRIENSDPVNIVNPDSEISLISSGEAAAFLAWLSTNAHTGPFNACSDGPISLMSIVRFIEGATGHNAIVKPQPESDPFSIFAAAVSLTINSRRAQQCGFSFLETRTWLLDLVKQESARLAH
jgi:nucleoside-diphosphate-sugar epimerase